jgi:hypothetical protein
MQKKPLRLKLKPLQPLPLRRSKKRLLKKHLLLKQWSKKPLPLKKHLLLKRLPKKRLLLKSPLQKHRLKTRLRVNPLMLPFVLSLSKDCPSCCLSWPQGRHFDKLSANGV